jgi:hypothetical protein
MATPPPIGVMPRWAWNERRIRDLIDAISRRVDAACWPIPPEWIEELRDLSAPNTANAKPGAEPNTPEAKAK